MSRTCRTLNLPRLAAPGDGNGLVAGRQHSPDPDNGMLLTPRQFHNSLLLMKTTMKLIFLSPLKYGRHFVQPAMEAWQRRVNMCIKWNHVELRALQLNIKVTFSPFRLGAPLFLAEGQGQ
ncbi:hypothetical protein ILYODFUR_016929 [Ilyodon furcidens]|uniref:Uncharacterized protein n=1 Tax=Ilyodon furcidens TaxID=33524 RepID=A0ABV0UTT9_9TELE